MLLKKITDNRKGNLILRSVIIAVVLSIILPAISWAQDPSGTATGTIKDLGIDTLSKTTDTTLNKVISTVNIIGNADGHNRIALNIMWTA